MAVLRLKRVELLLRQMSPAEVKVHNWSIYTDRISAAYKAHPTDVGGV